MMDAMMEVILEKVDDTLGMPETRRGYLVTPPAAGEVVVLLQDDSRCVVTSRVVEVVDVGTDELRVATRNSSYRISIVCRGS
jgi:hypothetical protein